MTPSEAAAILHVFERADDYESLMWRVEERAEAEHKDAAWWIAVAHKIKARDGA